MNRNTAIALTIVVLLALVGLFLAYFPVSSSRPTNQAAAPDPKTAHQFSGSQLIDAELRRSVPSYVGLGITPEHEIKLTLANSEDFQKARELAATRLAQLLRDDPNPFNRELGRASFVLVEASLGPKELADARLKMRDVLTLAKVVYLDLDESCGCITVGISDGSAETGVRSFATRQGVPSSAVKIVLTPPIVRLANLQGSFRPTMGGAQIEFNGGGGPTDVIACSLGLPVFSFSRSKPGFLTASHCTAGSQGAMLGTWIAQPGGAAFWGDKIGVESVDMAMFDSSINPLCPTGRMCRFSDTAFIDYDSAALGMAGHIVRPQARCSGGGMTCDLAVARLTDDIRVVLADGSDPNISPALGDIIDKVGRTTGWSSGAVIATCADVNVTNDDGTDSKRTLLCQDIVAATSDHGDSGSPVFAFNPATGAAMFEGILWGGDPSGKMAFFICSPVNGIEKDLGTFAYNEAGVTAPFFSAGEFYTSDSNDDINVKVEPNAVAVDQIAIVLKSGPGINWKKELVLAGGGSPPASATLTVINSVKMDNNSLAVDQLPGSHLEFRKLYWGHSGTSEVSRIPLDAIPPGTRVTFTWMRD
jgi:hypothetical protein